MCVGWGGGGGGGGGRDREDLNFRFPISFTPRSRPSVPL